MTKFRTGAWAPAVVLLLVLLWAPLASARLADEQVSRPPRQSTDDAALGRTDIIMHDIGNVRFSIANYGECGNPNSVPGFKGFEFPIGSGSDFLFSAGVWVGALVNGEARVTTATDGDNGTGELYPLYIGSTPAANAISDPDWALSSKNFSFFADRYYVLGAKGVDDDISWTLIDDQDGDGKASANWDGGKGFVNFDDDGDGLVDEDPFNEIDDDADGKVDEDPDQESDDNHDGNCGYDPETNVDEDPAGDISNDYLDNDFDGLVDLADPDHDGDAVPGSNDDDGDGELDEDGAARGVQEYYAVMTDNIPFNLVSSPDGTEYAPLNIQVLQRSYAFPEAYAADFILLDYRIRNVGQLPLKNVYIAMFSDPDIGAAGEGGDAASLDDGNYYDALRTMMIQYDNPNDNDVAGPGIFAIRVVKTPVALNQLRVTFANFERVSGGDPTYNSDKYQLMNSNSIAPATTQFGDWRMLISFGAAATNGFEIQPGEELPITVAFIGGVDTVDGAKNAEWALAMYLNDFQGPSAPDAPEFGLTIFSDRVRIQWENNSEQSVDAITGRHDFEGYVVERSSGQDIWQTIAAYDLIDRVDTLHLPVPGFPDSFTVFQDPDLRQFEWLNYNLGMPGDSVRPGGVVMRWDSVALDSVVDYYYLDDNDLTPGHTYIYTVRAYDKGVAGAGVLYSSATGNTRQAVVALDRTTQLSVDLDSVYVFPNPYKGSHAGEQTGVLNPESRQREYPRQIFFRGLPAKGKCIIRIFTLGGDHLQTIHHENGTEQDSWNLITKNSQEIVSGIYYYTVEYTKPGGGTDYHIDKFVVIK